jgi:hypothetical protein
MIVIPFVCCESAGLLAADMDGVAASSQDPEDRVRCEGAIKTGLVTSASLRPDARP